MEKKTADASWKVSVVTPVKNYSGLVVCPEKGDKRTISILNNDYKVYIKDCNLEDIPLVGFLALNKVSIYHHGEKIAEYDNYLIKKDEIIYAYDEFQKMGEKKESQRIRQHQSGKKIEIITTPIGNSCFIITGNIISFKNQYARNKFIPVANAVIRNIKNLASNSDEKYLDFPFIALNRDYIGGYSCCNL